jgi:hypothetical protein
MVPIARAAARSGLASALVLVAGAVLVLVAGAPAALAFEVTEEREPCEHRDLLRRPLFGDLHVHTSYSFDSYTSSQRNDPWAAYGFAKGDPIQLPDLDGDATVTMRLRRPLDFASITDHSEFLGEMSVCTGSWTSLGWWMPLCFMTRSNIFIVQLLAASGWADRVAEDADPKTRAAVCRWFPETCAEGMATFWGGLQKAAEAYYDRSSSCRFTSFVGYEYTDTPGFDNLHRNVIFRNERVPEVPISSYDTGARNFPLLWELLRERCIDAGEGCDVLSIPHNSNLSGGLMFLDPETRQQAEDRLFFEPVVELIQHKAASECRFDRQLGRGLDTADELCTFEQNKTDNLSSLGILFGEVQTDRGMPVPLDAFGRRNMVRNALKDGLALERSSGLNPFRMGFIGSTDTHSAIPGGTEEEDYVGHLGRRDAGYRNVQDHFQDNPGGLAVVWAEENSRDAIFEGLRRREAYATSGTRPVLRFFGGFGLDESLCTDPDAIAKAYAQGVPMGGVIEAQDDAAARFFVSVLKDPGTEASPGTDLQRVQVVKGWIDAAGNTHEAVLDVAGDAANGAGIDPQSCAPVGRGASELCTVWEDPDYDASAAGFYYARVLENPTCRWSTRQCIAAGVNPFAPDCAAQAEAATAAAVDEGAVGDVFGACCSSEETEPFVERVIQERAWSSPIWLVPRAE